MRILYFRLLYFQVSNYVLFLHCTLELSFYIDVALTLSMCMQSISHKLCTCFGVFCFVMVITSVGFMWCIYLYPFRVTPVALGHTSAPVPVK